MAGFLKKNFPECRVLFLGRGYTKEVIALSRHIDEFINYDELEKMSSRQAAETLQKYQADCIVHVFPKKEIAQLAKLAGIPLRVGTTNRLYHWFTSNKLIALSRKNSDLHEAQLNFKLLSFTGIDTSVEKDQLKDYYGFDKIPALDAEPASWTDPKKFNLILHPRSKGSAREWGLDNFTKLIDALPEEQYTIFVSGTAQDAETMKDFLQHTKIKNITGKLSLRQFIAFIHSCDGLIAASTGPLHIAAALNKKALGLFSPRRPIHPGRWAPVGEHAGTLVFDADCPDCKSGKDCNCIRNIEPQSVIRKLQQL